MTSCCSSLVPGADLFLSSNLLVQSLPSVARNMFSLFLCSATRGNQRFPFVSITSRRTLPTYLWMGHLGEGVWNIPVWAVSPPEAAVLARFHRKERCHRKKFGPVSPPEVRGDCVHTFMCAAFSSARREGCLSSRSAWGLRTYLHMCATFPSARRELARPPDENHFPLQ